MSLVWHEGETDWHATSPLFHKLELPVPNFWTLSFSLCLSPAFSVTLASLPLHLFLLQSLLGYKPFIDSITLQYLLTVGALVWQNAVGWVGLYWITCGKKCVLDFSLTASTYLKPGMLRLAVTGWLGCRLIPDASTSYWSSRFIYLNHTHPHVGAHACMHAHCLALDKQKPLRFIQFVLNFCLTVIDCSQPCMSP